MKQTSGPGYILHILALLAGGMFLRLLYPYATVIILAIITVYFFLPVHKRILKRVKDKEWLGLILNRGAIIITFVLPLSIISYFLAKESHGIVQDLAQSNFLETTIAFINNLTQNISFADLQLDSSAMKEKALSFVQTLVSGISSKTIDLSRGIVQGLTNMILYIFIVSGLLIKSDILLEKIKELLPLSSDMIERYIDKLGNMGSSMISSTFIIAALQGVATALSFWVVGIPYFVFFACVISIVAIIPMVGASFVALPAAAILIITGNLWGGIGVLLFNQIVVNNIDNVIRPKLVKNSAKIDDTLLILSLFGGLYRRGMMGILYGPVLMSFILTTFDLYTQEQKKLLPRK